MSSTQDLMNARPMPEPKWPRCERCGVELVERKEPKTGKVVRSGGRELLECPQCHEMVIAPSPRKMRGLYRTVRLLLIGSATGAGMMTVVVNVVRTTGVDGLNLGLVLILCFIAGIGMCVHCLFEALVLAISPNNTGGARFESGFLALFWAVVIGLQVLMAVKVGPEIWRAEVRGRTVLKGK